MLCRPILRLYKQNSVQTGCRSIFWWGHDSIKDQEARIKAKEDKKVIKWEPKGQDLALAKETFYAPARISAEESALSSGFSWQRFNLVDWFGMTTHPYSAILTDRQFYANYRLFFFQFSVSFTTLESYFCFQEN